MCVCVFVCFLFSQVHFNMALCVSRLAHNMVEKWVCERECVNVVYANIQMSWIVRMHLTHRIGNNMKIKRLCWKWMRAHKCQHASNHFFHFIHFYQIFLIFEISICLGFICSFSSVNLLALPLLCFSTNFESFVNFNLNLVHSIRLYRNSARLHAIEWRWLILKELMMVVKKTKYTARWVSAWARGRTVEFSLNVPKQNEFWDTGAIEKTEMKHRETEKKTGQKNHYS